MVWVETKDMGFFQDLQKQETAFVLLILHGSIFFKVYFSSVLFFVLALRENTHRRKAGDTDTVGGRNRRSCWDGLSRAGLWPVIFLEQKSPLSFG